MTRDAARQPDQDPTLWDRHVAAYEAVFEPLTDGFAARALDALVPGGRVAVVTWTEPQAYELAARIGAAVAAVRPPAPHAPGPPSSAGPPPAQLRYAEPAALVALMEAGGFPGAAITRLEARLEAPSARALSRGLAFAPGLDALMAGLGADRAAVEAEFARALEADRGVGPVSLGAVAHMAVARRTA